MGETKLLPCPFCGTPAKFGKHSASDRWYVECPNDSGCRITPSTYAHDSEEGAISAWNTRAKPAHGEG